MASPIQIATRGSPLALAQANLVLAECRAAFPDEAFELKVVKTTGDKLQTASLASAELPKVYSRRNWKSPYSTAGPTWRCTV
jgi:porphobilinogen deaminase